jgi:DEAD/DEAH box helicase domain-containing protein
MPLENILRRWKTDPTIGGNIAAWRILPARDPQFKDFPETIHPHLVNYLSQQGISHLYIHQLEVWNAIQDGENVVIATGTASGKTLAYNLPVVDRMITNSQARALYIFPTKALAQDQFDELQNISRYLDAYLPTPLNPGVYDGDTPAGARPNIRKNAHILLTNPDMLHTGILPHHTNWMAFLQSLQFIVIDEIHTYRGVFGSHVANVIRRLKRIANFYGSQPCFLLTSATIANPGELAQKLVEEPFRVIDQDGSQRGQKHFLIYNPPVVNEELGIRRSLLQETVRLSDDLLAANVQTVAFGRTRRSIELVLSYLRQQSTATSLATKDSTYHTIRGYRSGYLPAQRREIEAGLRDGQVRIVVATSALELGIDIGQMEAAVLAGYPGTIASTWQQAGRAGRSNRPSLAVMLVSASPLDQYLARFPDYFFSRSAEQALINPDNLLILLSHLRCAAFELPFKLGEGYGKLDQAVIQEMLEFLVQEGSLHYSGDRFFWMTENYPAQAVSLRSASTESILLHVEQFDGNQIIGEVDYASASWLIHPGAVYLHEGQVYQVGELDLDHHTARLQEFEDDYFTEPSRNTTVKTIETLAETQVTGAYKAYGEIQVTSQVIGYRKLRWYTAEPLGYGDVELPPNELLTTGYWINILESTIEDLLSQGLWNNHPNRYGPHWESLRRQARARDGYRCQVCGQLEGDREHDVHHKKPFRAFSSPSEANQLNNLITLCSACHHKAERVVRTRSGLAGIAFVLGNISPLFLMCDSRDLGVHADAQSLFVNPGNRPNCGLVIYDQIPAGIGLSERLYDFHHELILHAHDLVRTCPCPDGCPSCVGPGGESGEGGKLETLALLKALSSQAEG